MKKVRKVALHSISTLASLSLSFLILIGMLSAYMYLKLPNVKTLSNTNLQVPLRIYTNDKKLIAVYGEKRRIPVSINKVPETLINAILATEDKRYFHHRGVDFRSLLRAAHQLAVTGRKSQGASTITMQVARNFFLSRKKTFTRKINEILLAIKIEHAFSKKQILELYLNKIYLGQRAYGVVAASEVYYGKKLNELTLAETAMIAGLPQAPSRNNPIRNPEAAKTRRNLVLSRMLEAGYINQATYNKTIQAPITASYHGLKIEASAPYVAEMVRQVMVEEFGKAAYTRGFDVFTTVDSNLQTYAQNSLREGLLAYAKRHGDHKDNPDVQGALVSVNPNNGAILALAGGFTFDESHFNRATQARRQPGSAFKPFIYSAGLAKGYTLASTINDAPVVTEGSGQDDLWRPHNVYHRFHGKTRLRTGLVKSRNLVSIRLLRDVGIPFTLDYLERFGFNRNKLPNTLSLALGSTTVTPLQMAIGYSVFANGGYRVQPYFIAKITEDGHEFYQAKPQSVCPNCIATEEAPIAPRVIPADNAYLMNSVLKDVIQKGTGRRALVLNRHDLAGKTGTTNDRDDAWFVGYTPKIVTSVWVGFDRVHSLHEYGAQAALPIWISFMKDALRGVHQTSLTPPENIVSVRIDPRTGLLAYPGQQDAIFESFREAYVPREHATHVQPQTPSLFHRKTETPQEDVEVGLF